MLDFNSMGIMKKIFIYILVVFQLASLSVLAIEDTTLERSELTSKVTYNDVLQRAKDHAYDIKISNYDTQIAKTAIIGAHADYLPKLMFMAGTEYTKNFRDAADSTVMSIGDAYINPYTRFQSVLGITLTYNLFDFGLRRANLNKAKQDVHTKTIQEEKVLQELELSIIDSYTKTLLAYKQLNLNKQILALDKKNLEMVKSLYDAGQVNKTDVNDREVKVQKVEKHIAELSQMLAESLGWLSFYTGCDYDIDNVVVGDLPNPKFDPMESRDYTKTLIWKYYDSEIKRKEFEVQAVKRTNLPKVNVYTRYYMYGSDQTNYAESLKDIKSSNWSIGANLTMPIFDGLKNYGDIKRVSLELEQMLIKRDKAIAEWMTRLATMRSNLVYLREQSDAASNIIVELKDKNKSKGRLLSKKIISPVEANDAKIELLESQIEYEKNYITSEGILNGIKTLMEVE